MIEDLDPVSERRATWRERWLLPAAGSLLLCAVLASSFLRLEPARASVLADRAPATGVKAIELPRTLARLEDRLQFSGTTGLTSMDLSDGFRDSYALADGRRLFVIEYPDLLHGAIAVPASGRVVHVIVRGSAGAIFDTGAASQPLAIAWVADGMHYQVGGAFTADELIRLAEQLR